MAHAPLPANEAVLDPEIVIAGARHDATARGVELVAAPFGVHGAGFDARNHAHGALRRARHEGREGVSDRMPPFGHIASDIGHGIIVIERRERLGVARIEVLEPGSNHVKGILRRASRHTGEIAYGKQRQG